VEATASRCGEEDHSLFRRGRGAMSHGYPPRTNRPPGSPVRDSFATAEPGEQAAFTKVVDELSFEARAGEESWTYVDASRA
jgi:hypothetical protein